MESTANEIITVGTLESKWKEPPLELIRAEEVDGAKVPDWMTAKLQEAFGDDVISHPCGVWGFLRRNRSWLDHGGTIIAKRRTTHKDGTVETVTTEELVGEPYGLDAEAVESIAELCAKTGCRFRISATSYHFPTRTVRVTILPNETAPF